MRLELVKDWMSRELITAGPQATLPTLDQLMADNNIRRIPIVENGRLLGIVTYGDVRSAKPSKASSLSMWEMNYLITKLTASEIMTTSPLTVLQDASIGEAASIMLKHRISGLPVVDPQGKLVGIITESDIFRMVVHDWQHAQRDEPKPYAHYDS